MRNIKRAGLNETIVEGEVMTFDATDTIEVPPTVFEAEAVVWTACFWASVRGKLV